MGLWRKGRSGWHRHWTLRERFRRVWLPTLWFLRSMGFSGTCLGLWSLIVSSSSSLLNPTKAATLSGTPALTFSARYDLCIVDFSHLGFFFSEEKVWIFGLILDAVAWARVWVQVVYWTLYYKGRGKFFAMIFVNQNVVLESFGYCCFCRCGEKCCGFLVF